MSLTHYILGPKHELIPCDLLTWAKWFETANRHVAEEYVGSDWVSTVFLGLDHRFGDEGPPIVFETMVFETTDEGVNWSEKECHRYATWEDAEAGHKAVVKRLWLKVNEKHLKSVTEGSEK